jgi:sulfite exporter TauE/SafE
VADGALVMLAFGLGTLPTLMTMGLALTAMGRLARRPWVRIAAGILVILMGLALLLANPGGHGHHAQPHVH